MPKNRVPPLGGAGGGPNVMWNVLRFYRRSAFEEYHKGYYSGRESILNGERYEPVVLITTFYEYI